MTIEQHRAELEMLRGEIELLMSERQSLLRAAGAAAVFVAQLDSSVLPENTYTAADILAHALNALREDTLKDALEIVRPEFEGGASEEGRGR
ncbi:MAG TPA: hypothetical protein VNM24_04045 [Burkholderiales bacterium]|jgi:Cu2+-containing amine oxidase|nr:hypothetical protein [Burkholderiales bacterium]